MSSLPILAAIRQKTLQSIKDAASRGDHTVVLEASHRLDEVQRLLAQHSQLEEAIKSLSGREHSQQLRSETGSTGAAGTRASTAPESPRLPSPREYAERQKSRFVEQLAQKGLPLRKLSGALYRSPSGATVGLASATERQPNRWFLGLPDGAFDKAVLLCESKGGALHAICLDKEFIEFHGAELSISGTQRKFNVRQDGPRFFLKLPGRPALNVTKHRNNYELIR